MKRACLLIICLALTGCPKKVVSNPPPPINADHSIQATWNQSFANNPACSASVTTSCISGFNIGYVVGTTQTQLATAPTSACTGTTQPESCTLTFNGIVPIGAVTFYVTTTAVDQTGKAVLASPANSSAVPVGADSATNVGISILN